ncbi:MAG: hypothetical protein ABIB71_05620 [Candidatus Woesearchaeota archaeon]
MDIITVIFSLTALVCGLVSIFWILKLQQVLGDKVERKYTSSAIIAIGFLFSYPLWSLFIDVFDFVSPNVKKISYLFFSAGYVGVLMVSHMALSGVEKYEERLKTIKKEKSRLERTRKWLKKGIVK